jgi:hypothetical protein
MLDPFLRKMFTVSGQIAYKKTAIVRTWGAACCAPTQKWLVSAENTGEK